MIMLFFLTSCGGGGSDSSASAGQVKISEGTPAPAAPAPVSSTALPAASPPPTVYGYTLAPAARPSVGPSFPVGKCIGMGSTLDLDEEGKWRRAILDSDFTNIRRQGFQTVRIPVKFSAHSKNVAPYTIDPVFLARVRYVVDKAVASDLNVIVDLHNFDEIMDAPAANLDWFVAMWRQVGATLADEPANVSFDLLNEPTGRLNNLKNLSSIMDPAIAAIRVTNPRRILLISSQQSGAISTLANMQLPNDPYIVPTFHYYAPMAFTHQGAYWTTVQYPVGRSFGSDDDIAELNANVQRVKAYMDQTGRVPLLGEFGAISTTGVPTSERIKYYGMVSAAFASIGIQNCAWSYMNGFIFYDDKEWVPGLTEALQTTTTLQ
jgi:endoglucanase